MKFYSYMCFNQFRCNDQFRYQVMAPILVLINFALPLQGL